jgi:hypothetical protein
MTYEDRVVNATSKGWLTVDEVQQALPGLSRKQVLKALLRAYGDGRLIAKKRTTPGKRGCHSVYASGVMAGTEPPDAKPAYMLADHGAARGELKHLARVTSVWDLGAMNDSGRRAA